MLLQPFSLELIELFFSETCQTVGDGHGETHRRIEDTGEVRASIKHTDPSKEAIAEFVHSVP